MKYIGVFTYSQVLEKLLTRKEILRQVASGELRKLGHDRYADKFADSAVCDVVSKGHAVSCLTALRAHGVWVPATTAEVHARGNADAYRKANNLCRMYRPPLPTPDPVDSVPIAFQHAVRCLDREDLVAVCDSIGNKKLMALEEMRTAMSGAPQRKIALLDLCNFHSQSGTESMVRYRLEKRRISLNAQVQVSTVGRVDLLVGDCLILEIDSEEYHRTAEQYETDRRRDRKATRLGYLTVRLTYKMVTADWADAEEDILAIVRERRHNWPRPRDQSKTAIRRRTARAPVRE
ncbi:hypothetical protein AAFP30_15785 [Gordonia sp. CPCC 205515]|uniref:endonuclease domain-containing protein n=1 Tax=Gordonia sp. CPCC 205515 TaxID=3140791 RepID=UPI003AF39E0E